MERNKKSRNLQGKKQAASIGATENSSKLISISKLEGPES